MAKNNQKSSSVDELGLKVSSTNAEYKDGLKNVKQEDYTSAVFSSLFERERKRITNMVTATVERTEKALENLKGEVKKLSKPDQEIYRDVEGEKLGVTTVEKVRSAENARALNAAVKAHDELVDLYDAALNGGEAEWLAIEKHLNAIKPITNA